MNLLRLLLPAFGLQEVLISSPGMGEVQFVANRWLATNEGDGSTSVTLLPANGGQAGEMQMLKYRIHVSEAERVPGSRAGMQSCTGCTSTI